VSQSIGGSIHLWGGSLTIPIYSENFLEIQMSCVKNAEKIDSKASIS
jgi:hypothetical protein